MSRRGRKRKFGIREPNGQLARRQKTEAEMLQDLVRANDMAKRSDERAARDTVLAQPHRRGDPSPEPESALGRLRRTHKLDEILIVAAERYFADVTSFRKGWQIRTEINPPSDAGVVIDPDSDGVTFVRLNAIKRRIDDINVLLVRRSTPTYLSVYRIVISQRDVSPEFEEDTIQGLAILARAYGFMRPDHPFR